MRRALVLSAAALLLGAGLAVPATAAPPQQCNAVLRDGASVYGIAAPTNSHYFRGDAIGDQKVRVVAEDPSGAWSYRVEPRGSGGEIDVMHLAAWSVPEGWVMPGALEQTRQLQKCLARRF